VAVIELASSDEASAKAITRREKRPFIINLQNLESVA
jgi:hypothetical protein